MENTKPVVKEELTTPTPSEGKTPDEIAKEEAIKQAQAGDKTPPNELLSKLQVEREKRRVAEDRIALLEKDNEALKSPTLPDESDFSDEGKIFKQDIDDVKSKVSKIEEDAEKEKVFATYPDLKDKKAEFDEYCLENKGMALMTAGKAFLTENNMLPAPRQGLEKTTGGDHIPPAQGMTAQEVKDLRENDYKKYVKLLSEDKIKIIG